MVDIKSAFPKIIASNIAYNKRQNIFHHIQKTPHKLSFRIHLIKKNRANLHSYGNRINYALLLHRIMYIYTCYFKLMLYRHIN